MFPQSLGISRVIIHPDYWSDKSKHGNAYDLALIEMDRVATHSSSYLSSLIHPLPISIDLFHPFLILLHFNFPPHP